ncbi:MAG: helix-turn-helix transcriptional regulator [Bacilli bacterium]|nr:helix-turn-helix transcriptional regulator [Bacilli bacterium]
MNIGKHLKTLREKNNLTQEQLADKLFVSRSNVSKWERNISLPDAETLLELSKIFNVSVDDILLGNNKNDSSGVLNIYKQIEKQKKVMLIICVSSIIIILLFLIYYFLSFYNSNKIFLVNGYGNESYFNNGIIIYTKEKEYLSLGKINSKKDILRMKLVVSINNEENIIYETTSDEIFLLESRGYNELELSKILLNKNKLNLYIYYCDGTYENIKLNLRLDYSNKNLIFKFEKNI